MKPDYLKSFYDSERIRDAVHEYLLVVNEQLILKAVREKKDVTGYAENKEVIDKAFSMLRTKYGKDEKLKANNPR